MLECCRCYALWYPENVRTEEKFESKYRHMFWEASFILHTSSIQTHFDFALHNPNVRGNYVPRCSRQIARSSLVDMSPDEACRVVRRQHGNVTTSTTATNNASIEGATLLRNRRQKSRFGNARGSNLSFVTASERHFDPNLSDFGIRQVGKLSDAQNVGDLF